MITLPERPAQTPAAMRAVEDAVRITSRLLSLPGVASPDWCDRAADLVMRETGAGAAGIAIVRAMPNGLIEKPAAAGFAGRSELCAAMPTVLESMRRTPFSQPAATGTRIAPVLATGATLATQPFSALGSLCSWIATATAHADPDSAGLRNVLVLLAHGVHDSAAVQAADALPRAQAAASALATIVRGFGSPEITWITPREQEVLELLVLGYSVREIGEKLARSPHTIHDYVKSMHRKLSAANRGALVARALGHHRFSLIELKPSEPAVR